MLLILIISGCSGIDLTNPNLPTEELDAKADCFGDDVHPAGEALVEDFPDLADYEVIMIWYCNGAEFEDIATALLTEEVSGADAEFLLRRLADGFSWEEIWQNLEIIEE